MTRREESMLRRTTLRKSWRLLPIPDGAQTAAGCVRACVQTREHACMGGGGVGRGGAAAAVVLLVVSRG
jgi:hypothetical protein